MQPTLSSRFHGALWDQNIAPPPVARQPSDSPRPTTLRAMWAESRLRAKVFSQSLSCTHAPPRRMAPRRGLRGASLSSACTGWHKTLGMGNSNDRCGSHCLSHQLLPRQPSRQRSSAIPFEQKPRSRLRLANTSATVFYERPPKSWHQRAEQRKGALLCESLPNSNFVMTWLTSGACL